MEIGPFKSRAGYISYGEIDQWYEELAFPSQLKVRLGIGVGISSPWTRRTKLQLNMVCLH